VAPLRTDVSDQRIAIIIIIITVENISELGTKLTMKSGVFWDVTPCGSCKNRRFGGT
jgi:hypothetical protein